MTETLPPSLARGAPLTPDTWADFVTRLRHDCVGEGAASHCTANAIFTVQAKRIVSCIDRDYCDSESTVVYCDESSWYSPKEYWDGCEEDRQASLNELSQADHDVDFLELDISKQWDVLAELPDHIVTGWRAEWVHINSHFTKDAAEAFIRRKKHDYREGIRVYVESQYYAWEFNAIKDAILSGKLVMQA